MRVRHTHVEQPVRLFVQVYLILDEFILGGEFEETSKKVSPCCTHRNTKVSTALVPSYC